jgi:aminobenzoyl-glutamate utilization protein B
MVDMIIEWEGVSAHAAATPWLGRSALHALEVFVVAANMMREQMEPTGRLHYNILEGGVAVNSIPDYSKLIVRYRGKSAENVTEYKNWLIDIAKGAALATQTKAKTTVMT